MSNAIRYDSLLVRELARELHGVLSGRRLDAVSFDRDRLRVVLQTRPPRRGAEAPSLLWQLHPGSGHLTPAPGGGTAGRVQLPPNARVASVTAPPDERILMFELGDAEPSPGTAQRIIIELITNRWNAVATDPDDRIIAVLRERETKSRLLRAGAVWKLPAPSGRAGVAAPLTLEQWVDALGSVPPGERLAALPRAAGYGSAQNAAWIIGDADVSSDTAALERAYQRYLALVWDGPLVPLLLHEADRWQPYAGVPRPDDVAPVAVVGDEPGSTGGRSVMPSLLDAFAAAAERAAAVPAATVSAEHALDVVAERIETVEKRVRRLDEERAGAADKARELRGHADVLMSRLHTVARGAAIVELQDFEGGTFVLKLDPAVSAAANAARLYDAARKRDRAAARIPALLGRARQELQLLESLAGRVRDGTAGADELARLQRTATRTSRDTPPALPYRLYRTSGGLEVRVGRGSRSNDELTFRHSSPTDIWLHARDVAGAHVILRWPQNDANPPAVDIAEAAVLAALNSRARTSGTVPVDWTRRKHVRKPRKAGPGLVLPERVKTVFVEPDPALEERLRADEGVAGSG